MAFLAALGGVNVAFAGGQVQFLADRVEGAVYTALVSPQGRRSTVRWHK